MPQVFISYSTRDKVLAQKICQRIESTGIECWIAPRNIETGSNWTEGIMHGIRSCRAFVLVFSKAANGSEHVQREVARAFSIGLPVIPFRTEEVETCESLSYFLDSVQWHDAVQPPLEPHLESLGKRLKQLLDRSTEPAASAGQTLSPPEPKGSVIPIPRRRGSLFRVGLATFLLLLAALGVVWFALKPGEKTMLSRADPTLKSIAVLPFESLSDNPNNAYFADGVQEEILNDLARIVQLRVTSRTSVMQYRADSKRDLRQIANTLGVAHVLEGTVRRDGNRVRVSTQLIDATSDQTLWADSFDRDLTDIFSIQSEVAQTVANKLQSTLTGEQRKAIEEKPTQNLQAYDRYLQGKALINKASVAQNDDSAKSQILAAVSKLNEAVALDPQFALAYCALTQAHDYLYTRYDQSLARRTEGDTAIEQARGLAPELAEVRLAYAAHLYYCYRDYERLRPELELAKRSLPNNADLLSLEAYIARRQGRFAESVQAFEEALRVDPTSLLLIQQFAFLQQSLRHFAEARRLYNRAVELAPYDLQQRDSLATFIFNVTGDLSEFRSVLATVPPDTEDYRNYLTERIQLALFDRDWPQAEALTNSMGESDSWLGFGYVQASVPASCYSILIARVQGLTNHPLTFTRTRDQLAQHLAASGGNPRLLSTLALVDVLLGDNEQARAEAESAVALLPTRKDPVDGPDLQINLATVYAWAGDVDRAFDQLFKLTEVPYLSNLSYGEFKLNPLWDPLRNDPRYAAILANLKAAD